MPASPFHFESVGSLLKVPTITPTALSRPAGFRVADTELDGKLTISVGFHPIYDTVVSAIRVDFAQNPSLEGFVGGIHSLGWFVTSNPQIAQFQDALRKFAPGLPASPATASGWTTAKLFELAAQNVPEQPTSQAILDGLWNVKNNDLGGLTYPLTYNREQKTPPTKCFFTVAVKKGQWTGGDKLVCV